MHRKILVVILVFHSMLLTYEFPDLCDVDHSEGRNVKLHKMKNEINYKGILIHRIKLEVFCLNILLSANLLFHEV